MTTVDIQTTGLVINPDPDMTVRELVGHAAALGLQLSFRFIDKRIGTGRRQKQRIIETDKREKTRREKT